MNDRLLFSVAIPTCDRNDALAACLERLAPGSQTFPCDGYEVVVTDDGTASPAERLVRERFPWAVWTQGPRKGPAANRNHGATLARGRWLAFTDDDCLPDPGWLAALASATQGEARALEGAIHPLGDMSRDLAECPVNLAGGLFWSANIAVRRDLFQQVGGFDERYQIAAHEDEDLQLRLREVTEIAFVPEARVSHPVRARPLAGVLARMPAHAANSGLYYARNARRLGIRRFTTLLRWVYKPRMVAFLGHAAHLRPRSALVELAWLLAGNSAVLAEYVRRRREGSGGLSQC